MEMEAAVVPQEIESEALSWPDRARAIAIADQAGYSLAASLLLDIAALSKRIIDHHKPIKDTAYAAHKAAVAAEKRLLDPLTDATVILKRGIAGWENEQARIHQELERKAAAEARKAEEDMRLALAVQAEELGADAATTEAILSTPVAMMTPVLAPTFQRQAGVSTSQRWRAEVTDIRALCLAIGQGRTSQELVLPNGPALNAIARAMKGTINVPGVRAVAETSVSARTR